MKVFNQYGAQYIAYNVNELVAISTMAWRVGSDGRCYMWNSATLFAGGDNKYYEIIVQNAGGFPSIALGDTGYAALP